jgi:hypothetical protein
LGSDSAQPVSGFDEVEGGLVVEAEFVEAAGHATPVFAAAEAAFNLVALLVFDRVERGRSGAGTLAVGDLVGGFRNGRGDPPRPNRPRLARED